MTCGTCKYWLKESVYSHGSYIYGHCCNKDSEYYDNIKEYDNTCLEHSHKKLMEKRAVVKEDEEVKILSKLINEAVGGIKNKGFMYSLPIDFLEGIE